MEDGTDSDKLDLARSAVVKRMEELRLSQRRMSSQAGISTNTLARFLSGESWPRTHQQMLMEQALGWPQGTITRIAEGEPIPTAQTIPDMSTIGEIPPTVGQPGGAALTILLTPTWREGIEDKDVDLIAAKLVAAAHEWARTIRLENEQRRRPPAE